MFSRKPILAALVLFLAPVSLPSGNGQVAASSPVPSATEPDKSAELENLKRENKELRDKVQQYKALEEDLAAQRIFEKAKSQLIVWLTFGGVAVVIAGVVGYKAVKDYLANAIDKEIESVSKTQIKNMLTQESQRQVAESIPEILRDAHEKIETIVQGQKEEILTLAQKQIERMITSGVIGAKTESAVSVPATALAIDYSDQMSAVKDQGPEGSVVGMSLAYALEYQIKKTLHQSIEISPRFIYYYARKAGGMDIRNDTGANLADAVKVLSSEGAVAEEAWPYKGGDYAAEPPESVRHAKHYKIKKSFRLKNVEDCKSGLEQYGPVVAGIAVYPSFPSFTNPEARRTGQVPLPSPSEQPRGSFSVCLVGYDDVKQTFKFINSWGPEWGDHGYGYLPFKYLEGGGSEIWAITM